MNEWLRSVIGTSLLASAALLLCPEGRVKGVTKLLCALVCCLALAQPVLELDPGTLSAGMAAYRQKAEELTQQEEEAAKLVQRTYIQDECEAYILSQAQSLGLSVPGAEVLARWDREQGLWYPWQVTVPAVYDGALAAVIEGELGIPEERQQWTG